MALRRTWLLAATVALLAGLLGPAHAVAAGRRTPDIRTYVALGDSFAAGPLIPLQKQPWGCLTSTNNYAELLAAELEAELRDATCSGAETEDMWQPQGVWPEPNPPQMSRLDPGVDLVTLQIGGNDIGFSGIAETCVRAAFEGAAGGDGSCKDQYVDENGDDELRRRIADAAPLVRAVIDGIFDRAPDARVLVLGYSGIFAFGATASCPAMGVGEEDALYLRGVHEALNAMIAEQAAMAGATYVDVYTPSAGHTACDLPLLRWVEPLVPANAAAPIHPNLTGMVAVAGLLEEAVTG